MGLGRRRTDVHVQLKEEESTHNKDYLQLHSMDKMMGTVKPIQLTGADSPDD